MLADKAIAEWLAEHGYHPRSNKHGDALCRFVLRDLVEDCPGFHDAATSGRIVYQLNYTMEAGTPDEWNMDLVIGPPARTTQQSLEHVGPISRQDPAEIWVALDAKSIMTEHGKARRNRIRDLTALERNVHRMDREAVVAGLVVLNMAERFRSPLRPEGEVSEHRHIERLFKETIDLMNGLPRSTEGSGNGLDAVGVIPVIHTNLGGVTQLVTFHPAPGQSHPLHYRNFLRDACSAFLRRRHTP